MSRAEGANGWYRGELLFHPCVRAGPPGPRRRDSDSMVPGGASLPPVCEGRTPRAEAPGLRFDGTGGSFSSTRV
jgi:hypothetical protein